MSTFRLAVMTVVIVGTAARLASASFPKPMASALPLYPELARTSRVAGSVRLWFVLGVDGQVAEIAIISGNLLLREATLDTVKSWRFEPGALNPSTRFETTFVYSLNVQQSEGEPTLTISMKDFRRVEIVSELYVRPIE